jgi:hypothetical protein
MMIALPPNLPPRIASMDEIPRLRRVRFRLWQIALSAVTVLVAGWCFTLSTFVGVVATLVAKHVLVAVIAAGLDFRDEEQEQSR